MYTWQLELQNSDVACTVETSVAAPDHNSFKKMAVLLIEAERNAERKTVK